MFFPRMSGSKSLQIDLTQPVTQPATGKVKVHQHSNLEQLLRIDEIFASVWLQNGVSMTSNIDTRDEDVRFCDDMLGKVLRSFATQVRKLPKGLCIDVMMLYLAIQALHTIEGDIEYFKGNKALKAECLRTFYSTGLVTERWSMTGVGAGHERVLLEQYHRCVTVFKRLPIGSQSIITDIVERMGEGIASFVEKDIRQGCVTNEDCNHYLHSVAGLVGEGLSRLFTSSGYESPAVAQVSSTLANKMGLLLQKKDIIRDFVVDYAHGRALWPIQVWKVYTSTDDLGELVTSKGRKRATACLNEMVTDALQCVPECLEYMAMIRTEEVFRFCAIPQATAIASLASLYGNPRVFTGIVNLREGATAQLALDSESIGALHKWFNIYARDILKKVKTSDPTSIKTKRICNKIIRMTELEGKKNILQTYIRFVSSLSPSIFMISVYGLFFHTLQEGERIPRDFMLSLSSPLNALLAFLLLFSITFLILNGILGKSLNSKKVNW